MSKLQMDAHATELEQHRTGDGADSGASPPPRVRRPRRLRRWMWWVIWIAIACVVAFLVVLAWVAHNAEPILRQRVIANLEQRFQSHVELDELHISVFKGLQVSGAGLRIDQPRGEELAAVVAESDKSAPAQETGDTFNARINAAPLISVRSFSFRAGIRQLMEPAMRIDSVRVDGLRLRIPPKEHQPEESVEEAGAPKKKHNLMARLHIPSKAPDAAASQWKIVVDKIVCNDVILTIATDKPGKQPLIFPIRDITFHNVGRGEAMPFEAHLINAKPIGEIASSGHFGPWVAEDPRQSHIDGKYSFTDADLGPIKGVAGILSSSGDYSGMLGRIDVTGSTDTPDFSLDSAQHKMPLHTDFNATVDGTTGDTILNSVHATLRHTVLEVQGSVIRANVATDLTRARTVVDEANESLAQAASEQEATGHIIRIAVESNHARIEDLLTLGVRTMPPLMDGAMTLRAHLTIPPGKVSVAQKMRVEGNFTIRDASFSNAQWQETMNKLSARASGDAEKAKRGDVEDVHPSMGGDFSLASAVLDISKLHFEMPGAAIDIAGKYSLDGNTFDFAGTASTTATASQMLTGWKSLLAKPFDKLLEKNGAGVQVPITISGTRSAPKFGVDRGKLFDQIKGRFKGGNKDQDRDIEQTAPNQPQPPQDPGPARQTPQ
ncbi:MAG TPA: hypothetical protein VN612_00920 [Acidobacteriaceae bacterium]|nr:hypothetical protein [Acidobacteriaceae bacterium]